ncbi:MAG: hypothetical protein ACTSQE_02920 [Candidatus Heimdallarchaeaceae archaeon]
MLFWEFWITVNILFVGILLLVLVGLFAERLTRIFPFLYGRFRILYGYIVVVTNIIAFLAYYYVLDPFHGQTVSYEIFQIDMFSAGIYSIFSFIFVVFSFLMIKEAEEFSLLSNSQFISVLIMQISIFLISSSTSWVYIYLGYLGFTVAFTLIFKNIKKKPNFEEKRCYHNNFVTNTLATIFFFLGIVFYNLAFETFSIVSLHVGKSVWEALSFVFLISSFFIFSGLPPFHFRTFNSSVMKRDSLTFLFSIQRSLGVVLIIYLSFSMQMFSNKTFFFWLFLLFGIIYSLWGALGAVAKDELRGLLNYISLTAFGIIILLLSNIFQKSTLNATIVQNYSIILFLFVIFVLTFTFQSSLIAFISTKYQVYKISSFSGLGKREKLVFGFLIFTFLIQALFPVTIGYFYTFYLLLPSEYNLFWIFVSILLTFISLISASFVFKSLRYSFFRNQRWRIRLEHVEFGIPMASVIAFIGFFVLCIFFAKIYTLCVIIAFNF